MDEKLQKMLKDYPEVVDILKRNNNKELDDYIKTALDNRCLIHKNNYTFRLESKTVDPDTGYEVVFFTSIDEPNGIDRFGNLFFRCPEANLIEVNRCKECKDIPIWETRELLNKCKVCDVCGEPTDLDKLHQHHYAGACCDNCIDEQIRDWNDNLHYYTD